MLVRSIALTRRNKVFLTTFAVVFVLIYTILAFNTVPFSIPTRKSNFKTEYTYPEKVKVNEALKKLAGASLAPSGVQHDFKKDASKTQDNAKNYTTNSSLGVQERNGEILNISRKEGILQDDFEASNTTGVPTNGEEPLANETKLRDQKSGHKYYHIEKPEQGMRQRVDPMAQKGIMTRFGFLNLPNLRDHAFLNKDEITRLAQLLIFDRFGEETRNEPLDRILSFANRKERNINWTNADEKQVVHKPLCPMTPPGLKGKIPRQVNDMSPPTFLDILAANPKVKVGGRYTPPCQPRSKIAIIVPFRGRESQLRVLLAHMNPIWQRQQIEYTVYTVSQMDDDTIFNKAKLMNIGFLEASKYGEYDCFVFHDVDMTLEDDHCLYRCPDTDNARELSVYLDKFDYQELKYRLRCRPETYPGSLYAKYFGGVAMMTSKQLLDVNGYSNLFWGWGSEDIDMYLRLWKRGYKILQPYGRSCSYHMIKHETESSNKINEGRFALLANSVNRMRYEGLTSIRYKILSMERLSLYTNITVEVGRPKVSLVQFMTRTYDSFHDQCGARLPWE